jgi:hypothetical protein
LISVAKKCQGYGSSCIWNFQKRRPS